MIPFRTLPLCELQSHSEELRKMRYGPVEVFVHTGCPSEAAAQALTREIQSMHPDLAIQVQSLLESQGRVDVLGIIVTPLLL